MPAKEQAKQLKQLGVSQTLKQCVEAISNASGSQQEQQMMDLLKKMHVG